MGGCANGVLKIQGEATKAQLADLTVMMSALRHENEPGKAADDLDLYKKYMEYKVNTSLIYYIPQTGFMLMDFVHDPLLKEPFCDFLMMTHVYIVPEKRKTTAYPRLLCSMLAEYDGQIIGLTYKDSDHNAVMRKRYKTLGTIYGRY